MKKERTIKRSASELRQGKTDWVRVDALTDREIEASVAEDSDAAALIDDNWIRRADLAQPLTKIATSIRVDADVLEWFRGQGRGWQTRINSILRAYAETHGLN